MESFTNLLQSGNAWLFIPSAILLGALHGLEPGHSKTMMAAFIVAIRGTVTQAILLGLAATFSHTAVVWLIALLGMHFGAQWNAETTEPYFQLASAVIIIGVALWMLQRTWREQQQAKIESDHDHGHIYHHDERHQIDTGHGVVTLSIFEENQPPHFRLEFKRGSHQQVATVETIRPDNSHQLFTFANKGKYWESVDSIPEPHEFTARLILAHSNHSHDFDVVFAEHSHHDHADLDKNAVGYQDAHELAHAHDIKRRFADREVTTGQIIIFGLTGGLIPCPAAITVLLLCLQLKKFTLGMSLVLCFSIGLALTMVTSGVIAALSVKYASKRWSGFGDIVRRAPYFSSALIILIGLYVGYQGWAHLPK